MTKINIAVQPATISNEGTGVERVEDQLNGRVTAAVNLEECSVVTFWCNDWMIQLPAHEVRRLIKDYEGKLEWIEGNI